MHPGWIWFFRVMAVILGMSHGYFLATVPAHWSEDCWDEDDPYASTAYSGSTPRSHVLALIPIMVYSLARMHHGCMMYGFGRVLAPILTFVLAAIGFGTRLGEYLEPDPVKGALSIPLMLLFERFFWIAVGAILLGYIAGRLWRPRFFTDRRM